MGLERMALFAQLILGAAVVGVVAAQGGFGLAEVILLLVVAELVLSLLWAVVLYWRERVWRRRYDRKDAEGEFYRSAWLSEQVKNEALVDLLIKRGVLTDGDATVIDAGIDAGVRLFRQMRGNWSLTELRVLAFDAGLDWENVTGDTVDARLVGLITAAKQAGRLERFAELAKQRNT